MLLNKQELQDIFSEARAQGVTPAAIAEIKGFPLSDRKIWPEVNLEAFDEIQVEAANLLGAEDDFYARFISNIAEKHQFPINSAFLHGLGVIASAMTKSFSYEYYGSKKPVTLYTVTAQPSSSGKSGVNGVFSDPVNEAFKVLSKNNTPKRRVMEVELERLTKELTKAQNGIQITELVAQITDKEEQLAQCPIYRYSVKQPTPESIEEMAAKQGGLFNIISDEADAINIMMGNVYSDKQANHSVFLAGWDGDWFSSSRVSRAGYEGYLRGSVAVIAQNESIRAILEAGSNGRGISERVLLLKESTLMGGRDVTKRGKLDEGLSWTYAETISNIVLQDSDVVFSLDEAAADLILHKQVTIESQLGDRGEYSNNMLRGFMGKCDKHMLKIASVLHGIREWGPRGSRSTQISFDTMLRAFLIFNEISKTYVAAADSEGFAGASSQRKELIDYLAGKASRHELHVSARAIFDNVRKKKIFKNTPKLMTLIREDLIPALEELSIIHKSQSGDLIFINPRLKS